MKSLVIFSYILIAIGVSLTLSDKRLTQNSVDGPALTLEEVFRGATWPVYVGIWLVRPNEISTYAR